MSAVPVVSESSKPLRRRLLRRFLRNERGATAIEFAILAIPFSLLLFAIIESCVSFAGQQILSNVADDVARQLRTGQLKASEMTKAKLEGLICNDLKMLASNCPTDLLVDLRQFTTFEDAAAVKIKYTGTGKNRDIDATGFAVSPGPSMSKNMLRVFYKWPVMTDFMRSQMSNLKDGKTLQFAAVVWQNEPFTD